MPDEVGPPNGETTPYRLRASASNSALHAAKRVRTSLYLRARALAALKAEGHDAAQVRTLQATPVQVDLSEVYLALSQRAIDASIDLARQLGAPLITYEGTQHTAVFNGIECIDTATVSYFVDGVVPGNLHC